MTKFDIEELLAIPMTPSIRVRWGPGADDALEIDQALWDASRDRFVEWALSIPNVEGASWRLLKAHTGQNGLMAKLLVALGELAGIWRIHPPVASSELWQNPMYPMVLSGTLQRPPVIIVGMTPSRGGLEVVLKVCWCCERPMGPQDSLVHELQEGQEEACQECTEAECQEGEPCRLDPIRVQIRPPKQEETVQEMPDPETLARYLAQFSND